MDQDGTTVFTGKDLESIYVSMCNNGDNEDLFLNIGNAESASSDDLYKYLLDVFENLDQTDILEKMVGFTAVGASNMQGKYHQVSMLHIL